MAAVSPSADQTTELLQKLSLDSQTKKTQDNPEVAKKPSANQYGSVNGGDVTNTTIPSYERSATPVLHDLIDQNMGYLHNGYPSTAFYVGGYDGPVNDWDDFRYVNHDGVEMPPGVYDMYHPGFAYASYSPYPSPGSPAPTLGHDGQLYGPQHYQYSASYYQPPTVPTALFAPNQHPNPQGEIPAPVSADQQPLPADATKTSSNGITNGNANGSNGLAPLWPSHQNSSLTSNGAYGRGVLSSGIPSGYQDQRFGFDGAQLPAPWFDSSMFPNGQHRPTAISSQSSIASQNSLASARNHNGHPFPQLMGLHAPRPTSGMGSATSEFANRMYTNNRMYNQYGNTLRTGLAFGSNGFNSRINGQWGSMVDSKYKPRGRGNGFYGYGNENLDGLSELNRGPRAGRFKNPKAIGPTVTIAVKGQNLSSIGKEDSSAVAPDSSELYNQPDFPENYSDAKFFIIKSYSEDDVHKSIKYSVWASTPNGNKKLDAGYREAQEKTGGCPVFLLFSVNTSGQFVGVAEMVGPVDFDKTVDYWQQDKWNGCFPVKWHIVKDVPNNILKHITLENNDNKPVTNSRDTQEVKLDQGLEMLKLFKEHVSKTSILDDFAFYEDRQKMMQEKKAKQQQLQKQILDAKTAESIGDKDGSHGKLTMLKPLERPPSINKEASQVNLGDRKPSEENGMATVSGDDVKAVDCDVNGS